MFYYKISNTVALFNGKDFAEWMKKHYAESKWKNYKDFAVEVKSNPATISRLMNASPQTLTEKASQPKADLVERIAKAFDTDVDEALILAGHAPRNGASALPKPLAVSDFDGFDDDDLREIKNYIEYRKSLKNKQ